MCGRHKQSVWIGAQKQRLSLYTAWYMYVYFKTGEAFFLPGANIFLFVWRYHRRSHIVLTAVRTYPLFAESLDEATLAHAETSHRNDFDSNTLAARTPKYQQTQAQSGSNKISRPRCTPIQGIPAVDTLFMGRVH